MPILEKYQSKRDFKKTSEPPPSRPRKSEANLSFVIQEHHARRLHYDLRLELDGVLKSWAVPKGVPEESGLRHLAVAVEDHPIEYGKFHGTIPEGQYGAGTVEIWDHGTYIPEGGEGASKKEQESAARKGLEEGKLVFRLHGKRLDGEWVLVHTKGENWLVLKHREPEEKKPKVIGGARPQSGRNKLAVLAGEMRGAKEGPLPERPLPMLASATDRAFSRKDWQFEPKLDGIRALAWIQGTDVRLYSRRGLDMCGQYPALVNELRTLKAKTLLLDGEITALDEAGRPSFHRLQGRMNLTRPADVKRADETIPVLYYMFDILHIDGWNIECCSLEDRRKILEALNPPGGPLRITPAFLEQGEEAYDRAIEFGFEGLVAKKVGSVYEYNRRSRNWLKIKANTTEEFVIGGYTLGEGRRQDTFGALLLGQFQPDGSLKFAGHVGTGFNEALLRDLIARFQSLVIEKNPFSTKPDINGKAVWLRPVLVAEIKFAEWTPDGKLRAPVFMRLCEDHPASDVVTVEPSGVNEDNAPADRLVELLRQSPQNTTIEVEGWPIKVTNLDKPMWPNAKGGPLTKRDLLIYLVSVSNTLLPHLIDRPVTLRRFPNGVEDGSFYQRRVENSPTPEFVETIKAYSEQNRGDREYIFCNNLPTLLWLGQLANLELHTWFSRVGREPDGHDLSMNLTGSAETIERSILNYPDFMVLDMDPYIYAGTEKAGEEPKLSPKGFKKTVEVALWFKDILDGLGLKGYLKTSGRTGLHIYVPIVRHWNYDQVREASAAISGFLLRERPKDVTMEWSVSKRTGKIFLDHNMNARSKTIASVYSPRSDPLGGVSMPVRWEELQDIYPTDFNLRTAPERIAGVGDLWGRILDDKQDLDKAISRS